MEDIKQIFKWMYDSGFLNKEIVCKKFNINDYRYKDLLAERMANSYSEVAAEMQRTGKLLRKWDLLLKVLEIEDEIEEKKIATLLENILLFDAFRATSEESFNYVPTSETTKISLNVLKKLNGKYQIAVSPIFSKPDGSMEQVLSYQIHIEIKEDLYEKIKIDFPSIIDKEVENLIEDEMVKFYSDREKIPIIYTVISDLKLMEAFGDKGPVIYVTTRMI